MPLGHKLRQCCLRVLRERDNVLRVPGKTQADFFRLLVFLERLKPFVENVAVYAAGIELRYFVALQVYGLYYE